MHKIQTMIKASSPQHRKQQGAALITGLIILLMLTIIGLTSLNTITMEERMSGNMRDMNMAFQSAEAALRDAELWMAGLAIKPAECTGSPCNTVWTEDALPTDLQNQTEAWWIANAREYGIGGSQEFQGNHMDPRYAMEWEQFVPHELVVGHQYSQQGINFYSVTARGVGGQTTVSILQTTVSRDFGE